MKEELEKTERTEEIQAIIDRMPDKFGFWITAFVLLLVAALGVFGWMIRYPDIVTGQIIINTNNSPVKLIANTSGKLSLTEFHSQDDVKEGEYLATIQNNASLHDIQKVYRLIQNFKINEKANPQHFPKDVAIGELNTTYFAFINAYDQFTNYHKENPLAKQEEILQQTLEEQQKIIRITTQKLDMSKENLRLINRSYNRDSILFSKKVLTEAELDKSKMNVLNVKDIYHNMLNDIEININHIQETINKMQQVGVQKNEKEKQVLLDLVSAYTALADNFKIWEQKYVFKSPINGKLQFLKFWTNDQFIQAGEPVFTIVPVQSKIVGQMTLPAFGAGKVKLGQEVIIKLEDYPYTEYGTIKGKILSISITTNTLKTERGDIAAYLITVDLPEQLKTNYGSSLDFKFEIKGQGEIITKDRRLIERLFDNLKYAVNK
ncbi:MAG TPA: hemolysin D [Sphingobacteriaceae bacterium]|nr:hemolysin D [Sphingobacteriaceae bacterium]